MAPSDVIYLQSTFNGVDFGEEGINMLTVRVSHQMASQI